MSSYAGTCLGSWREESMHIAVVSVKLHNQPSLEWGSFLGSHETLDKTFLVLLASLDRPGGFELDRLQCSQNYPK